MSYFQTDIKSRFLWVWIIFLSTICDFYKLFIWLNADENLSKLYFKPKFKEVDSSYLHKKIDF